jgi:hypothetical protein
VSTARLELPSRRYTSSPGCSSARLAEIVARLLTDEEIALGDRVAGLFVVLFAQQVTRVSQLRLSDLVELDGELFLRLGDESILLPTPVGALVSRYTSDQTGQRELTEQSYVRGFETASARICGLSITRRYRYLEPSD